jgi:multidrug resistance protein, MATE family
MVLAIVVGILIGLVMILVRNLWGYAYSTEEEVVKYISKMMPILAVSFLFDCVQCVLSGKYGWYFKTTEVCKFSEPTDIIH